MRTVGLLSRKAAVGKALRDNRKAGHLTAATWVHLFPNLPQAKQERLSARTTIFNLPPVLLYLLGVR
jgi:hypothetical protein